MAFTLPPNCTLWLESDFGLYQSGTRVSPGPACVNTNDPVGLWLDQSGQNNDASASTSLPKFVANSIPTSGLPGVTFNNGTACKLQTPSMFSSAYDTAFTMFIVEQSPTLATNSILLSDGGGTTNFYCNKNPTGNATGLGAGFSTPHLTPNASQFTPHGILQGAGVWAMVYGGQYPLRFQYERQINAASNNNGGNGATGNLGLSGVCTIGNLATGAFQWKDTIHAVGIFNRALSFEEQRQVTDYLTGKYKLNLYKNDSIIIVGNSLTVGTGSTNGPAQLQLVAPPTGNMGWPYRAPTVNVTGGGTSGGNLTAGTYNGKITYSTIYGESQTSPEFSFTIAAGNIPTVTTLYQSTLAQASWSMYLSPVGGASGTEVRYQSGITTATFNLSAAQSGTVVPPSSSTNVGQSLISQTAANLTPNMAVYADAYPGRNLAEMIAECPYTTNRMNLPSGGGKILAHIWEITNDITASGDPTGVTTYNNLVTLANQLTANGMIVTVGTCIPRNDGVPPSWFTAMTFINNQVRANWRTFCSGIVDYQTLPHFQTQADCSNATYYAADLVHLTDLGYNIMGKFTASRLFQILYGGNPVANVTAPNDALATAFDIADLFQNNQASTVTQNYGGVAYNGNTYNVSATFTNGAAASIGTVLGTNTATISVGGVNRTAAMVKLVLNGILSLQSQLSGSQQVQQWSMGAASSWQTMSVTITKL